MDGVGPLAIKSFTACLLLIVTVGASAQSNTFPSSGNAGIGTLSPTAGALQIAAPDQSVESAISIRQSNAVSYGFDFALDQKVNGMGYLFAIAGSKTSLMQFDRINNFVGVGLLAPQAKLHITDAAKTYASTNNQYDSNVEIQGTYGAKTFGQGPSLGFVAPANSDGSNPWEVARILAAPAGGNNGDAQGMMFLQTRGNNASTPWVWNNNLVLASTGNVGVGTTSPAFSLDVTGQIRSKGGFVFPDGSVQTTAFSATLCGGDYAESVNVTGERVQYEPGDVLVIDSRNPGKFVKASQPYSTLVAGIYSTKPGTIGRRQSTPKTTDEVPMALTGIVPVKVTAENGPIKIGDLLVASSTPGRAMKGTNRKRLTGAVLGKALGSLNSGDDVIEALVTLQ